MKEELDRSYLLTDINKSKNNLLDSKKRIEILSDREKFIISSRKLNEKSKTLEKIGKELNISKERVRQIEVNSLKKLKKNILKISNQSKDFFLNYHPQLSASTQLARATISSTL